MIESPAYFFKQARSEIRRARACLEAARERTGSARDYLLSEAADALQFAGVLRRTAKRTRRFWRKS